MKILKVFCLVVLIVVSSGLFIGVQAYTITSVQAQSLSHSFYYIEDLDITALVKDDLLSVLGMNMHQSWQAANNLANGLIYDGLDDWRLPSASELLALYEAGTFENFSVSAWYDYYYWTNELVAPGFVRVVSINAGAVEIAYTDGGPLTCFAIKGFVEGAEIISSNSVPEPSSMLLLGVGLIGLARVFRRK